MLDKLQTGYNLKQVVSFFCLIYFIINKKRSKSAFNKTKKLFTKNVSRFIIKRFWSY